MTTPDRPVEPADDLRDRLSRALALYADPDDGTIPTWPGGPIPVWQPIGVLINAVMAVVQPVLDRQAAEIARLQALACPGCMAREQERDSWAEATRQTGIKAEEYKQAADHWRQRAEAAERELTQLRAYHQQIGDL